MAAFFAIAFPVFLIMAALAVNVAYMELVRTELRTSTDLAARAAARTISFGQGNAAALAKAQEIATLNQVANAPLQLASGDVTFGRASRSSGSGKYAFNANDPRPNAVQVLGNRTASNAGGAVGLFFSTSTFEPVQDAIAAQIDRDLVLVLDRSGSMASTLEDTGDPSGWTSGGPVPDGTKWDRVSAAAKNFLDMLAATPMEEKVGLVTYSDGATIDIPLTFDYTTIEAAIDSHSASFNGGYTNIAAGISHARQALCDQGLDRSWAERTIVVMTDGNHNTGETTPSQAANTAQANSCIVHTITYGTDADQVDMQGAANIGHGRHWHAPNQSALLDVFEDIADNAPTLLVE